MSNLLEKASIITTPTAYDDGRILSVKPNENIYGSELVTSFTNGTTYPLDTFVSSGNNVTSLIKSNGFGGCVSNGSSYTANDKVIVSFTYNKNSGDDLRVLFSSVVTGAGVAVSNNINISESGDYTLYFTISSTTTAYLQLGTNSGSASINGSITNISAKKDLSGDFNFERGSAATRVNAQGLVENVQILSSELVQNGNFSEIGSEEVTNGDFSQEGSELITNGDFATDSDWGKGTGWSIANGLASCDGTQVGNTNLTQGGVFSSLGNKNIKISFTVSNYVAGSVRFISGNGALTHIAVSTNGVVNLYFNVGGNTGTTFNIQGNGDFVGSIDNVSVVEVGQDWELQNGWSIGNEVAVFSGSVSSYRKLYQENILTIGKIYKLTFDIVSINSGSIKNFSQSNPTSYSTVGTKTEYFTASFDDLYLEPTTDADLSITNISVKEVGQDWTFGTGWSIGDGVANYNDNANNQIAKNVNLNAGIYKLKFSISNTTGNGGRIWIGNFGGSVSYTDNSYQYYTNGDYTLNINVPSNQTTFAFYGEISGSSFSITNISIVEVTDDTDLPRINYEGFSYQDALGSELITNGDFAVDGSWAKGTGWTISGGSLNALATATATFQQNTGIVTNKTYKVTYTISNYVSGSVRIELGSANVSVGLVRSANGTYTEYIEALGDETIYFDGIVSFTGSIDNVSVKEYLGQEVVPNSGCGSWLFEPQSTNLITYSEDISDSSWTKSGTSVTSNNTKSPDGNQNADLIVENSSNSQHFIGNALSLTSGNSYSVSVYAKKKERSVLQISPSSSHIASSYANYDLDLGVVSATGGSVTAEIEYLLNDWYRCILKFTATSTATASLAFFMQTSTLALRGASYQGNGTNGLYLWGAQVEQLSYPTSYIPTNGAASTRLQDIANNSGNSTLINSTEGVLYAEMSALANYGGNRVITIVNSSSTLNRVRLYYTTVDNRVIAEIRNSSGGFLMIYDGLSDATTFNKFAVKYKNNDAALWINGIEVLTDTSGGVPIGLNSLNFDDGSGSDDFFGKTKALVVFKEALTDAELELLTAPAPEFPTFTLDFDTIAEQFTFTRGSEATFVNEQGLIQSTNELGAELITNGGFDTNSDWSANGWVISNGQASNSLSGTGHNLFQGNVTSVGGTFKVVINVTISAGSVVVMLGGGTGGYNVIGEATTSGTFTYYGVSNGTDNRILLQTGSGTTVGSVSIDNVSVKEVISATNTPRIDYSTGVKAFLLEPQSTNLITYSEDFSDSSWNQTTAQITSTTNINPSGNAGTFKIENIGSGSQVGASLVITSGNSFTNSWYVKKISGTGNFYIKDTNNVSTSFTATDVWQRFQVTAVSSSTTGRCYLQVPTPGDIFEIWGAQLEQQSYATSYIPTNGASATRNQETCADATPTINSEEGVLYAEISALANDGTFRYISLFGDTSNHVQIYYKDDANKIAGLVRASGNVSFLFTHTLTDATNFIKVAIKYKQNNFSLWVNGVEVGTDTSGDAPIGLSELDFDYNGGNKFFGNTKGLQVFDKALSDYQLKQLTTI